MCKSTLKNRKIYGNCQIYSPSGLLMFRCDEKRLNWYLQKNLASIISQNPLSAQLNFTPKGLGNHNKPFGLAIMVNRCVACGTDQFLTRHHIVPFCYRKHFPIQLKSHNFHDVLSLCSDCHSEYEKKATDLKKKIAQEHDVPIFGICINNKSHLRIIKNCNTLLLNHKIPQNRITQIRSEIVDFLGREIQEGDIETIAKLKQSIVIKSHGQVVVEKISDIQSFIQLWRRHFIDNVDCKYLPDNWDVNNVIITNESRTGCN